jgi:hypothetical protein
MSTPSNEHPWRGGGLPGPSLTGRDTRHATNPGHPSVIAAIDGADMAPDDDFYINRARTAQESDTYIKVTRLA